MRIFKSILLFMNIAIYSQSYSEMIDELKSRGRWGDYYLKESDSFMLITKNINVDSLVFIGDTSLKLSTLNTLFKPIERSSNSSIANLRFKEIKDNNIFISSKSKLNFARYGNQSVAAVVDVNTNEIVNTGSPKDKYGSDFGGNNMLTRQDKTGRLFQANTQSSATGLIVINEKDLTAIDVIRFANSKIPWGMWVDEANELLFAALPNANSVGVVDLKSLEHVLNIQVGECPYAVSLDIERKIGVSTNQGTPSINTSATVFDLCKVYEKLGRKVIGCP